MDSNSVGMSSSRPVDAPGLGHGIKIRIHIKPDNTPALEDVLAVIGTPVFLVREVGEEGRPHFQGFVYTAPTQSALKRLRNDITRKLGIKGNGQYSVASSENDRDLPPERYIRYLCKGPDKTNRAPPEVLSNPNEVDVSVEHAAYWAEFDRLVVENPKGYKKRSIYQVLQEECDPKAPADSIYIRAVELHHEAGKIPRRNTIKDMVFGIRTMNASRLRAIALTDCAGL